MTAAILPPVLPPILPPILGVRELRVHQFIHVDALPLVVDQQVVIGRERLDPLREAFHEVFGIASRRLAGDGLHDAEQILGAMADLAEQQAQALEALKGQLQQYEQQAKVAVDVPPANLELFKKHETEIKKYVMPGLEVADAMEVGLANPDGN